VKRRVDKKVEALPPPSAKPNSAVSPNKKRGGEEEEERHKGSSNGRGNGKDYDGDGGDEEEEQRIRTDENDEDETEDDDDALAHASASSTQWPDDAFTDMSAPERYITLASPTAIAAVLSGVGRQEEAELAEAYEGVYKPSDGTFRKKIKPRWSRMETI
jgi:hypothetical protein